MELTWICPRVLLDGLISSNTGVLAERRFCAVEEWMHITGKYEIYEFFIIWDTCMLSKYH
jgi:hypothetical protein